MQSTNPTHRKNGARGRSRLPPLEDLDFQEAAIGDWSDLIRFVCYKFPVGPRLRLFFTARTGPLGSLTLYLTASTSSCGWSGPA